MLTMLSATMNGMVNEAPRKPRFVLIGEALIVIKSSPTVSCHQGVTSDTAINKIVVKPPARANQLNFVKTPLIFFTPEKLDSEPPYLPCFAPVDSDQAEVGFH